jgi:hypothetical protein
MIACPDGWTFEDLGTMHLYRAPGGSVVAFEENALAVGDRAKAMEAIQRGLSGLVKPRLFYFKHNAETGGATLLLLDVSHPGPWVPLERPPEIRMGRKEPV